MRGRPVQHLQFHAFDLEILLVLGNNLRGEMIGGRCAPATGSKSSLLLLFIVLVGNDRDASGERCQPIDVIAVAVRENDGGYRLWRDFGDIIQQFFSALRGRLGVDDDHAFVADDDSAVSATAFDPVNVWLQLVDHERSGCRSLSARQCSESDRGRDRDKPEGKTFSSVHVRYFPLRQKLYHAQPCAAGGVSWTARDTPKG